MPEARLNCQDCGAEFVFTEAEQALFRDRGFTHSPKRCKECRARNRQGGRAGRNGRGAQAARQGFRDSAAGRPEGAAPMRQHAADATGSHLSATAAAPAAAIRASHAEPAPTSAAPLRPPRPRGPMHATTCSICGVATEVPFVPDGVRPVYCLPCLKRQTR